MRINNNMSAVITNKQLLRTENNLTKSMERLSSGLKINHAKDNPAGMAISNKMQAQIDALDRASSNASDGTSVLQIADGALNETSAILQRMRELFCPGSKWNELFRGQTGNPGRDRGVEGRGQPYFQRYGVQFKIIVGWLTGYACIYG